MTENTTEAPGAEAPRPRRRRRWIRFALLGGLLAFALLVAFAPVLAAPIVRGIAADRIGERVGGRASIRELSLSWSGAAHVRGVEVSETSGAPVARVDTLDAKVDLLGALRGHYVFDVRVQGFEAHLRQRADGHWNVEEWVQGSEEEEEDSGSKSESAPLDARGAVSVSDGRIVVEAQDGASAIEGFALEGHLEPPGTDSSWKASFTVTRDGKPAGGFASAGRVARKDASLDPRSFQANGTVDVDSLPLALLEPFLPSGSAPARLRGAVDAQLALTGDAERARLEGEVKATGVSLSLPSPVPDGKARTLDEPEIAVTLAAGLATEHLDVELETCELRSNLARGTFHGKLENVAALLEVPQASTFRASGITGELHYRPERLDALLGTSLAATLSKGAEETVAFEAEAALEPPGTPSTWKASLRATQGGKPAGSVRSEGTLERKGAAWDPAQVAAKAHVEVEKFPLALLQPFLGSEPAPTEVAGQLDGRFDVQGGADRTQVTGSVDLRDLVVRRAASGEAKPLALEDPHVVLKLGAGIDAAKLDVDLTLCSLESRLARGSLRGKLGNLRALLEPEPSAALVLEGLRGELDYRPGEIAALLGATLPESLAGAEEHLAFELDGKLEPPGRPSTWKAALTATQGGAAAGTLRSEGTLERKGPSFDPKDLAANGSLVIEGFPLAIAEPFLASPGTTTHLAGTLGASLTLQGTAEHTKVSGKIGVRDLVCRRGAEGAEKPFELNEPALELALAADVAPEQLDIVLEKLAFEASFVRGSASGRLEDLAALSATPQTAAMRVRGLAGELWYRPERVDALFGTSLAQPDGVAEEHVAFGLEAELAPPGKTSSWKATLGATRGGKPAGKLESAGTLERRSEAWDPQDLAANGTVSVEAFPLALLQPFLAASGMGEVGGELGLKLVLAGDAAHAQVTGDVELKELALRLPAAAGAKPLEIAEPHATLSLAAGVSTERLDVDLTKLAVDARLVRGTLQGRFENLRALLAPATAAPAAAPTAAAAQARIVGAKADFRYVPERVGALLGPFLPVKLSGAEERAFVLELSGASASASVPALLAALDGHATIGLGGFETTGLTGTGGELAATFAHGEAKWTADVDANGGKIALQGSTQLASLFDAKAESKTTLSAKVVDVGANSRLAPLLSALHPAFAAAEGLEHAEIGGLLNCDLDLGYDGPLAGDAVSSWDAFPKSRLHGKGKFSISAARLQSSPLFQDMLSLFGVDANQGIDLKPLEFSIENGRVSYAKAWTWTIQGAETSFTGSVGLDRTLALAWNVPITDSLVKRYGFLESLRGQKLELPIGGTVTKPKLDVSKAMQDLALKAAQEKLLGGALGGKPGGGESAGGAAQGQADEKAGAAADPAQLLAQADELWDAGKKAEAAPLYKRLEKDFKLSLVYVLNKDRIKRRADYKP